MKKTLYISDLDGTLLNSNQALSNETVNILNHLLENKDFAFTIATARSHASSHQLLSSLNLTLPRILYNGTIIYDAVHEQYVSIFGFESLLAQELLDFVLHHTHSVLVYTIVCGKEEVRYIELNEDIQSYLETRKNDPRMHYVSKIEQLYEGDIFYLTLIGKKTKLEPLYLKIKDNEAINVLFGEDLYHPNQYWLEIKSKNSSKANACLFLKEKYGYQELICFGDSYNDLDMFEVCNQVYAVENASEKLKAKANCVIGKNDESSVAKFLWSTANI